MWNPSPNWVAYSSFPAPVAVPAQAPLSTPYVYVYFNATWLPYVLGALQQLVRPHTWQVASEAELLSVLGEAQDLLAQIAAANGPQPPIFQVTAGGLLQVSTDGGTTWTTVLPFYAYPGSEVTTPVVVPSNVIGNGEYAPLILNANGGPAIKNQ